MSSNELEVRIKIGEIEFYAKGQTDDVEVQRQKFTTVVLPAAVDIIKTSQSSQSYIMEEATPTIESIQETKVIKVDDDFSNMSVNEFINSKGFKSLIDIAIGLVYYYERYKGCHDFSSDELKQYFRDVRITPPKNPSDVIKKLFGKSFIMNGDDKKRYYLTQSGKQFVNDYTPKEAKIQKVASSKTRKKPARVESDYAHLSADDLNLKKYPEIKAFKTFKERMMLVLYIVKEEGFGDEFSSYDVQVIMTDILGHSATKGQVQGVFDRNATWFKTIQNPNDKRMVKHRLLNDAIEYAKGLIASTNE